MVVCGLWQGNCGREFVVGDCGRESPTTNSWLAICGKACGGNTCFVSKPSKIFKANTLPHGRLHDKKLVSWMLLVFSIDVANIEMTSPICLMFHHESHIYDRNFQ